LVAGATDRHGTVAAVSILVASEVGGNVVFESPWAGTAAPKVIDGSGAIVLTSMIKPGVYSLASNAGAEYTIRQMTGQMHD
jgi:hypothetical protein